MVGDACASATACALSETDASRDGEMTATASDEGVEIAEVASASAVTAGPSTTSEGSGANGQLEDSALEAVVGDACASATACALSEDGASRDGKMTATASDAVVEIAEVASASAATAGPSTSSESS